MPLVRLPIPRVVITAEDILMGGLHGDGPGWRRCTWTAERIYPAVRAAPYDRMAKGPRSL